MNSPGPRPNLPEEPRLDEHDLSAELATPSGDYLIQVDINHVLGKLFEALAANRISSKRAATLAYICFTILKSQEGMHDQVWFMTWTAYKFLTKALHEKYFSKPASSSKSSPKPPAPHRGA